MLTFSPDSCAADIVFSDRVPKPIQGLYSAAYIAIIKQGMTDYMQGRVPSRGDIKTACRRLNGDSYETPYPLPKESME